MRKSLACAGSLMLGGLLLTPLLAATQTPATQTPPGPERIGEKRNRNPQCRDLSIRHVELIPCASSFLQNDSRSFTSNPM